MSVEKVTAKRSLSVNQRLLTLGVAAFAGFAAMIGAGWYQNGKATAALVHEQAIRDEVTIVNAMRLANLEMVLAAMDSIVDKQDRKVAPERIEKMKTSIALMRDNAATVQALAASVGKADTAASYSDDLGAIEKAVLTDLVQLVEGGAADNEFSKIDDAIDGAGERMSGLFATLTSEGHSMASAAVADAQLQSQWALYAQLILGGIGIILMAILFPFHSGAIRRGVEGVRDSLLRIRNDELDTPVVGGDRGDEFGDMARAAESLRQSALDKRALTETTRKDRDQREVERSARESLPAA